MILMFINAALAFEPTKEDDGFTLGTNPKNDAIINGVDANRDDYPNTGGMLMSATIDIFGSSSAVKTFVCSSTLIAPDVVLTAAHCLDDTAFTFGLGEITDKEIRWSRTADLSNWNGQGSPEWPSDAAIVSDWVIHPGFSMDTLQPGIANNKDIALLFLETPITDVDHAFLVTPEIGDILEEDMTVEIVGWGQSIATNTFEEPPPGSVYIKQQGLSHIAEIGEYEFQVGLAESDVRKCHGDSGGPSFLVTSDGLSLIGVTSHAYDQSDCFETGGVDTRVDAYLDWIEQEMQLGCENGTRSWCETSGIVSRDYYAELERLAAEEEEGFFKGCATIGASEAMGWYAMLLLGIAGLHRRRFI